MHKMDGGTDEKKKKSHTNTIKIVVKCITTAIFGSKNCSFGYALQQVKFIISKHIPTNKK